MWIFFPYGMFIMYPDIFFFFGNLSVPDVLIRYRTFIYFDIMSHLDIYWERTLIRYSRVNIVMKFQKITNLTKKCTPFLDFSKPSLPEMKDHGK